MNHSTLYFDGACQGGNPAPSAGGAVLYHNEKRHLIQSCLLDNATNNIGEYAGLIVGLRAALAYEASNLVVYGDSQLVIRQMVGQYACKAPGLKPYYTEAMKLAARFEAIEFHWVRREMNKEADYQSKLALSQPKGRILA